MKIDYSYDPKWKKAAHLPTAYVFGAKHLVAAFHPGFGHGVKSRIAHLLLGIVGLIFPLNLIATAIEFSKRKKIEVIHLKKEDPFERGEEFGQMLRKETKQMYSTIKKTLKIDAEFLEWRARFEKQIPEHMKQEMRGLAKGAQVSYEDVLNIHTFMDIRAGQFGCSVIGTCEENKTLTRAVVANHSDNDIMNGTESSRRRAKALQDAPIDHSNASYKRALRKSAQNVSIQSIIFNPRKGHLHLATGWSHSPKRNWHKIKGALTVRNRDAQNSRGIGNNKVKLARNLDWPWPICGSETIVVSMNAGKNKNNFVNVTWPGYLGVLSGMNEKGVALSAAQCGDKKQEGMPVSLLFRSVLEETSSTNEALRYLKNQKPASSMNLVVASHDGIAKIELDPERSPIGPALVEMGS